MMPLFSPKMDFLRRFMQWSKLSTKGSSGAASCRQHACFDDALCSHVLRAVETHAPLPEHVIDISLWGDLQAKAIPTSRPT